MRKIRMEDGGIVEITHRRAVVRCQGRYLGRLTRRSRGGWQDAAGHRYDSAREAAENMLAVAW